MFFPKQSRWSPIFFTFLTSLTHHLSMVKFSEKNQCYKNFARTSLRVHTTMLASMCHAMPFFSSRSEEKHFLWRWCCGQKWIEMWFIVVCTLTDNEYVSLLVSQTFSSYCFCILSEFVKVSERKVWRVQEANLHNTARALSSSSRCFQLSRQIFISLSLVLWLKKQIECGLGGLYSCRQRYVLLQWSRCCATNWVRSQSARFTLVYWVRQQHTPMGK